MGAPTNVIYLSLNPKKTIIKWSCYKGPLLRISIQVTYFSIHTSSNRSQSKIIVGIEVIRCSISLSDKNLEKKILLDKHLKTYWRQPNQCVFMQIKQNNCRN